MPYSRAREFHATVFQQSVLAHVLSHPARIIILQYLLDEGCCTYSEIKQLTMLARPTVLQHVRILRDKDLVVATQIKGRVYYELNEPACQDLFQLLLKFVTYFAGQLSIHESQ